MSVKHLTADDPLPPLKPGILRVYSMKFCPFAQLARLTLAHKNILHEIVNIHLKNKPLWFLDRSPLGTVPCLETPDGQLVWDSGICVEYLDSVYPQNKLIPDEPLQRAVMKMWMELYASKTGGPFFNLVFGTPDRKHVDAVHSALEPFEALLGGGQDFFGGMELNLLDIRMWPYLEKVNYIRERSGHDDFFPADRFPKLTAWQQRMQQMPAAIVGGVDLVNLAKFDLNNPDYDVGMEI